MTTTRRTKYVISSNTPSILPFPVDVDYFRDRPKLLGVLVDQIDIQHTSIDPYKSFFENHTLPVKLEKKIL